MRIRFKQAHPLSERLATESTKLRERAVMLRESPEREELLRRADQCDMAVRMDAYLKVKQVAPQL